MLKSQTLYMEKTLERAMIKWVLENPEATVQDIMKEFSLLSVTYSDALMILTIVDELGFDEDE